MLAPQSSYQSSSASLIIESATPLSIGLLLERRDQYYFDVSLTYPLP